MTTLSLAKLSELKNRYEGMQRRVQTIKKDAEEKVMIAVQSAEIIASSFSMGVINGRWNRPEFLGVPVDALSGLTLHAAGFLIDDKGGGHLHNLGDGALASYMSGLGLGVGLKMRTEALNPSGAQLPQG